MVMWGSRDGDVGVEMVIWGAEMVIWGAEMVMWGAEMVIWGVEMKFVEKVEESVLQGNPHIVLCPCFSVDLENDE